MESISHVILQYCLWGLALLSVYLLCRGYVLMYRGWRKRLSSSCLTHAEIVDRIYHEEEFSDEMDLQWLDEVDIQQTGKKETQATRAEKWRKEVEADISLNRRPQFASPEVWMADIRADLKIRSGSVKEVPVPGGVLEYRSEIRKASTKKDTDTKQTDEPCILDILGNTVDPNPFEGSPESFVYEGITIPMYGRMEKSLWKSYMAALKRVRGCVCNRLSPYCSGPIHGHHILEVNNGGTNLPKNIEMICASCHHREHPWMWKKVRYA